MCLPCVHRTIVRMRVSRSQRQRTSRCRWPFPSPTSCCSSSTSTLQVCVLFRLLHVGFLASVCPPACCRAFVCFGSWFPLLRMMLCSIVILSPSLSSVSAIAFLLIAEVFFNQCAMFWCCAAGANRPLVTGCMYGESSLALAASTALLASPCMAHRDAPSMHSGADSYCVIALKWLTHVSFFALSCPFPVLKQASRTSRTAAAGPSPSVRSLLSLHSVNCVRCDTCCVATVFARPCRFAARLLSFGRSESPCYVCGLSVSDRCVHAYCGSCAKTFSFV